jgi:Cft2 family RNA processing exonuclease
MNITFNGGAGEVGGSAIILETDYTRIALDYGIKVEEGLRYDLPRDLDAVIVTHAHLDHSGNLLTLSDSGITLLGSEATRDVTLELLDDLIKVHRMKGEILPYDQESVRRVAQAWTTRERLALPGMEIRLHPAGHVLGARMAHLKADGKDILYTGDFCLHETEILPGADTGALPKGPDVLIMESTYGGTIRPSRGSLVKDLFDNITQAEQRGGNILLPTFAFHRLQEMALRIDTAMENGTLPKYNAYYLSGLGHRINGYFHKHQDHLSKAIQEEELPFDYHHVKHLRRTGQIREPAIVICTAGFGHAGASRRLLFDWIDEEENTIIISSGYLPEDSPLNAATEAKIIEDEGRKFAVNATVKQIELSGHADQTELVEFVRRIRPSRTFLVHGNPDQSRALADQIGSITDVTIPSNNEDFQL